jgi:hypothetical protein
MSDGESLLVFSNEQKANDFMNNRPRIDHRLKQYSWDELVDKFGGRYSNAVVDHRGKIGFYQVVPLRKGI